MADDTTHGVPPDRVLAERLLRVRSRIDEASVRADRDPSEVRLIGITKTHPTAVAAAAVRAGLIDLGENRVDELVTKAAAVPEARWHLVGRLQTNKARDAIGRAALIHSVDRAGLVDAISRRAVGRGIVQAVLVQVNVGEDPAKGGCSLAEAEDLVAYARSRPGVRVEGLMTVPPLAPAGVDPGVAARPHFATLRALRDRLGSGPDASAVPGATQDGLHLSMGMSDDLEAAVAEGATMVRVGSALFGAREDGARGAMPRGPMAPPAPGSEDR